MDVAGSFAPNKNHRTFEILIFWSLILGARARILFVNCIFRCFSVFSRFQRRGRYVDFARLLADPIMEDTVVKQLFFSSRRYGRFSLHSVRCDACAIRLNIAFFHVFWFPTDGIPIRQGALFGRQIGSPKRQHSKKSTS